MGRCIFADLNFSTSCILIICDYARSCCLTVFRRSQSLIVSLSKLDILHLLSQTRLCQEKRHLSLTTNDLYCDHLKYIYMLIGYFAAGDKVSVNVVECLNIEDLKLVSCST